MMDVLAGWEPSSKSTPAGIRDREENVFRIGATRTTSVNKRHTELRPFELSRRENPDGNW